MAEPIRSALVKMGERVRVYAPVGELLPGMAYLVRRLLENTSNESFLRRGFAENVSKDVLLAAPAPNGKAAAMPKRRLRGRSSTSRTRISRRRRTGTRCRPRSRSCAANSDASTRCTSAART
jgi:delta 1-pyrroline-5-carboxylate dehydrogenase